MEVHAVEWKGFDYASFEKNLLKIPKVKVPNLAGFDTYSTNLNLVDTKNNDIEFKVKEADLVSSNYSEHAVSIASAVIESYMANARDTIISFKVEGGVMKYTLFRYTKATQNLVNGSIQVVTTGAFASMDTYKGCKDDVASLECVKTIEKIMSSTLTGLGAGILCGPAGPYAAMVCTSVASNLTKEALDKAFDLAYDAGVFTHKVVNGVSNAASSVSDAAYDFGVSVHQSDLGSYLDWVERCGLLGGICKK